MNTNTTKKAKHNPIKEDLQRVAFIRKQLIRKQLMPNNTSQILMKKLPEKVDSSLESLQEWKTTITDLSDDELLLIISKLDFKVQFRVRRVCQRWKSLVEFGFRVKKSISFVNNSKDLTEWKADDWFEVTFPKDYIRVNFAEMSEIVTKIIAKCPNIKSLDMECFDLDMKTLRLLSSSCQRLERLNFDSTGGFVRQSSYYLIRSFPQLKYLNLSCCEYISEQFLYNYLSSFPNLVALNVCGSNISGHCLSLLGLKLMHLNISYCWHLEEAGILSLTSANCHDLQQLAINNFEFELADESLIRICTAFKHLKYLDMSLGPCTQQDYYINTLTNRGFSAIARLTRLKTLIVRKICSLDDPSLSLILENCRQLKHLVIDMQCESLVTNDSIGLISRFSKSLQILEISGNRVLSGEAIMNGINGLIHLRKLVLRKLNIRNVVAIFAIKNCPQLNELCLNGCQYISRPALDYFISKAKLSPNQKFDFEAISTGFISRTIVKNNEIKIKNIANNLIFRVSNRRSMSVIWFDCGQFGTSTKPKWF